jgi:recombinational DNA repair ATPase RecF
VLSKLLKGVGPSTSLTVDFSDRLNLITGDNGVGKSFLLDLAWWVLAGQWARPNGQAVPREDAPESFVAAKVNGNLLPL